MRYLILAATLVLAACSSANSDNTDISAELAVVKSEVQALRDQLTLANGEIAALESKLGPRIANTAQAKAVNPNSRVGSVARVYYTETNCAGTAYIPVGVINATGARQGFVFMVREQSDTTNTESPYYMVAPGTAYSDYTPLSQYSYATGCGTPDNGIGGYAMVANDVDVCGVPDAGLPTEMWLQGAPPNATSYNATEQEVWTGESCLTVVPSNELPTVVVGSE